MRSLVSLLTLWLIGGTAAHAQYLSADEIVKHTPGVWGMDTQYYGETDELHYSCEKNPVGISFSEDGRYAVAIGREAKTYYASYTRKTLSANGMGALEVFYEEEDRTYPNGELIKWHVFMQSKDTFVWDLVDYPGARIRFMRRCPQTGMS